MVNSDVQKISKYALGVDTLQQIKEPMLVFNVNPLTCNDLDYVSGELSDSTSATIITTPLDKVFRVYAVVLSANSSVGNASTKIMVNGTKNSQTKALVTMRKTASVAMATASITQVLNNPVVLDKNTAITITCADGTATVGAVATIYYTVSER